MRLDNEMPASLKQIYDDLKRFRNPETGGPRSGLGRDIDKYPILGMKNVLISNEFGIGGGTVTWTALVDAEPGFGYYPVAVKFLFPKENPIILSKSYKDRENYVRLLKTFHGKNIFIPKIKFNTTKSMMRCSCKDFRFRWEWWLQKYGSLIGRPRTYLGGKGIFFMPPVNPKKTMGLCKHVHSIINGLDKRGIFDRIG